MPRQITLEELDPIETTSLSARQITPDQLDPVTSREIGPLDFMGIPAEAPTPEMKQFGQELGLGIKTGMREIPPLLGAAAGGMAGAASPVPGGALIGAGLGYAMGRQVIEPPKTALEGFKRVPGEVATGATFEMGGQTAGEIFSRWGLPIANRLGRAVKRGIEKSIRPGVAKQRTAAQTENYFNQAEEAVKTIILNKNRLNLTDESGKQIAGLPKTLKQFEDAIDQTKRIIFRQYDDLAAQTGQEGIQVSLGQTVKELHALASNTVVNDMAPELARYAAGRAQVFAARGTYTPAQAQEAIQTANNTLKAFYAKPTPEMATKARVDALIANNLRRSLDDAVTGATGESYQALKNTYGALKALEEDVAKRVAVDARRNIKGLIDFSDIFSGSQVAAAIVSGDPIFLAKGVVAKAIANTYRYVNNPNRIVASMFKESEKIMRSPAFRAAQRQSEAFIPPTGAREPFPVQQPPIGGVGVVPFPTGGPTMPIGPGGQLSPGGPARPVTGPPIPSSTSPLITQTIGGQAPRPAVSPGPEPVIPPRAPVIVQRPGTAPESSKVGAQLTTPKSVEGTKAPLPGNLVEQARKAGIKTGSNAEIYTNIKKGIRFKGDPSAKEPYIYAAAVRLDDGRIIVGKHGGEIWDQLNEAGISTKNINDHGFITNSGKYLSRDEAAELVGGTGKLTRDAADIRNRPIKNKTGRTKEEAQKLSKGWAKKGTIEG